MKTCLYVGSFDPITNSHLNIVLDLLKEKEVDFVYFLPVNSKKQTTSITNRINMLNLVIKNNPKIKVLNILNYTNNGFFNYKILEKLNLNITHILMGSDLFLKFNIFLNYQDILNKYYLIVIKRNNFDLNNYVLTNYNNYLNKIIIINKEYLGSSTISRKELVNLDKEVLDYIKENNLYN